VTLDRSTLCDWVGRACWWLAPLHELMMTTVLASPKIFADDTNLPVLDPGRGKTKTGRLWRYAVDNRPWCGPGHPAAVYIRSVFIRCWRWYGALVSAGSEGSPSGGNLAISGDLHTKCKQSVYIYSDDRKGVHPAEHLKGYSDLLQVDGYAGFARLVTDPAGDAPQLAFCWAHARRKVYDVFIATKSPIAEEAVKRIAALYAIEAGVRGEPAEERQRVRHEQSRPLVEAMHVWLTEQLGRIPGASTLAKAIRYALNHWNGLIMFLEDGRIELDTNTVERAIRPVTITRKNSLFAGNDNGGRHWAIIATLVRSAKLNGVEPLAWLTDVLERIVSGRTKRHELDTLAPWNWKAAREAEAAETG
jgi:hypothetical protein